MLPPSTRDPATSDPATRNPATKDPAATAAGGLRMPVALRSRLRSLAGRRAPHEACGLLVGERSAHGARVLEVTEGRNLEAERPAERFTLDPVHLLTVEAGALARGLEVLGVWHSHPRHPARPSETDRTTAWGGWSYVIVSGQSGRADWLRSWRLADGHFSEEALTP